MENSKTINEGQNPKKSWYQLPATWLIAAVLIAGGVYFAWDNAGTPYVETQVTYGVSAEYLEALDAVQGYMDYRPFSLSGLTEHMLQDGYDSSAVAWSIAQIEAETDWYQEAVEYGEYLLHNHGYTLEGLYDSLIEEGFTEAQASGAIEYLAETY